MIFAFLVGAAVICGMAFLPPLPLFIIGALSLVWAFVWALCLAAARGDRIAAACREDARERADERAARDRIYGQVR